MFSLKSSFIKHIYSAVPFILAVFLYGVLFGVLGEEAKINLDKVNKEEKEV